MIFVLKSKNKRLLLLRRDCVTAVSMGRTKGKKMQTKESIPFNKNIKKRDVKILIKNYVNKEKAKLLLLLPFVRRSSLLLTKGRWSPHSHSVGVAVRGEKTYYLEFGFLVDFFN
jgi:hypothetical protein